VNKISVVSASLLFLFAGAVSVSAQNSSEGISEDVGKIISPDYLPPPIQPGFIGQDHKYSVIFRGNGEAVVSTRVILTNKGSEPLREVKLRIPKVEPKDVFAYQIIKDRNCIRYPTPLYEPIGGTTISSKCLEYQEPNYYYDYYGASKYQKAESSLDIDTLTIKLSTAIAPDKTGAYIIYFRTFGYAAKDSFGAFKYSFESLKVEDDITNLSIGISTDSDLFLKGVQGKVEYRLEESALKGFDSASVSAPQSSQAIDSFVAQIGQGEILKTASNLAPLESYKVAGAYASSRAKLYGKEIVIAVLAIVVLVLLIIFSLKVVIKKFGKQEYSVGKDSERKSERFGNLTDRGSLLLVIMSSFVSSLLITGYTALIYLVSTMMSYGGFYYQYQFVFGIFLLVISVGVYSVLLFAPAIYFGIKKGLGWGVGYLVISILWLILYAIVAFIIFFLFAKGGGGYGRGPVLPLMEKAVTN